MSNPARYTSLIRRQKSKLAYAHKLLPRLVQCVEELGPNPSMNEVARWLQERRIKPSANAKPGSKWVAQTVQDYLYCDGIDPTVDAVGREPSRYDGFRVTASREFWKAEPTMRLMQGDERVDFERSQLDAHIRNVAEVAALLRSALRIPARE
jgi:hypothetical protein